MPTDRHPVDHDEARRQAGETAEVLFDGEIPDITSGVAEVQTSAPGFAEALALWLIANDPSAQEVRTIDAAAVTSDLTAGMFLAAAVEPGAPFSVTVNGSPMTFHGNGVHFHIAPDTWMPPYWWYRLSRSTQSRAAVNVLTRDQILRDGHWARHRVHMYDAFIALDNDEPDWIDHVHLALETVGRPAPTDGMEAQYIHKPLLHMLIAIDDDNQDAFTDALVTGIETHRRYWTRNEKFAADCEGFTSIPLAAICALAVDRGLTIAVESDYLPTGLIAPGWYRG